MKKHLLITAIALMGLQTSAQNVSVSKALFKQGDDMNWAKPTEALQDAVAEG